MCSITVSDGFNTSKRRHAARAVRDVIPASMFQGTLEETSCILPATLLECGSCHILLVCSSSELGQKGGGLKLILAAEEKSHSATTEPSIFTKYSSCFHHIKH